MAQTTLSPYPGRNFDLATYLRTVTSKKFGIADPRSSYWGQIGQVASGQVSSSALDKYRKMQFENPLMKPGDIRAHFNKLEQESRLRKLEDIKRKSALRQAHQISGMSPEEATDFYTRMETQRQSVPGQVLNQSGKSLDDILAAQRGEGIWARQQAQFSQRMAPKQLESYREGIQSTYDIANQALWTMADYVARSMFTQPSASLPDGTPIWGGQVEVNGVLRPVKESDFGGGEEGHALWVTYQNTQPVNTDVSSYGTFCSHMYAWLHGWAEQLQDDPAATQLLLTSNSEFINALQAITPISFDAQIPVAVNENMGLNDPRRNQTQNMFLANGSMYDGMLLDSQSGLNFALAIPEDETWQVKVVNENGKDVIRFVNVTQVEPTVTPTVVPEIEEPVTPTVSVTGEQYVNGELYRLRDFSIPQYLTPEQANVYFPGITSELYNDDTVVVQAAADGNLSVTQVISSSGWIINFGDVMQEDGTTTIDVTGYIDPSGNTLTSEEFIAYINEQEATEQSLMSSDMSLFGNSSIASVHTNLIANPGKNNGLIFPTGNELVPGSLANAGLQQGQVMVQITEPTFVNQETEEPVIAGTITASVSAPAVAPWLKEQEVEVPKDVAGFWTANQPDGSAWPTGTEIMEKDGGWSVYPASSIQHSVDEYGRPVINVFEPGGPEGTENKVIAQYHLPSYDDSNLPSYVHKVGNEYLLDISTPEGFQHLVMYYPERFFNILANTPRNDVIDSWLMASEEEGGMGWDRGQVRDFYENYGPTDSGGFWDGLRTVLEFPGKVINWGANVVGDAAGFIFDPYGHDPVGREEISNFFSTMTEGAVAGAAGKFLVPYIGISGLAYTAEAGWYAQDDPELRQKLADGWNNYGLTYFFNGNVCQDLELYSDAPDWLLGATDVASIALSGGVMKFKPKMPLTLKTVRTGTFSVMKNLRTIADVRVAAAYNGYGFATMKKGPYAGSMRINVDHKYVYLRNVREANHYFKTGNVLGDTDLIRMPASTASHKVSMNDGSTIRVPEPKAPEEILTHLAQNHPGRLGAGFMSFIKAKGFEVTNGKMGSPFKSGRLAPVKDVLNATREAIEQGVISIDQMIRSANQIRLWQDGAADALAGNIISQLNARFGYIDKMLTIKDGVVIKGIKSDLPGAPIVNGKVSHAWNDVFEHHKFYEFDKPNVHRWIDGAYKIIDDLEVMATKYGIEFNRKLYTDMLGMAHYFPRGRVIEKIGAKVGMRRGAPSFPSSKLKEQNPRAFELQQEGLELGYRYDTPANTLASYISHVYRAIANAESKKLFDSINLQRAATDTTEIGKYTKGASKVATEQAKNGQEALNVVKTMRYHHVIPNIVDMAKVRRFSPELADKVESVSHLARKYGGKEKPRITFVHFSDKADLNVLDPKYFETGVKAAEAARKNAYPQHWVDRINVYTKQKPAEPRVYELPYKYSGEVAGRLIDSNSELYRKIYNDARTQLDKTKETTIEGMPGKIVRNITQEEIITLTEKLVKERGYAGIEYDTGTILFHKQPTHYANVKPGPWQVTKGQFIDRETSPLVTDSWTIVTSFKSDRTLEWNNKELPKLENEIARLGYSTGMRTLGKYQGSGIEVGFMVPGMPLDVALKLCNDFKQESVMTNRGLLFKDGQISPCDLKKTKFSNALTDNYTEVIINGKPVRFSIPIDWETKFPYDMPWSVKVTEAVENLYYEADQMLREAVGIAKEQKQQRAAAVEAMRHIGFTEATGNRVGLYGSIFEDITVNGRKITGKEIETMLEHAWHNKPNLILRSLSDLNRNLVMLQTIDIGSAAFIQGVYTLGFDVRNIVRAMAGKGKPSFAFAQSYIDMLGIELSPKVKDVFRLRNEEYMDRAIRDGLIISESGTEFIQRGTFIEKALTQIPVAGYAYGKVLEVANRGFAFWGESARVRMGKYLEREWLRQGGTGAELQEMLNNMTGVTSSKTIGVGVLQRTYESIGLFAPRFLRANLMQLNRMMPIGTRFGGAKRGMTGRMLYETMAGTMAGWTGIYVALCGVVPGNWPPKLKPWPKSMGGDGADAFTLSIGGQNIGILGGFPFSFMKMWGTLLANAIENPKKIFTVDFSSLSAMDQSLVANNPLYQFMTGRASPAVSLVREMVTGKDYMGYSLAKGDYLGEVAELFMPFVLQSIVTQEEPANPAAFVAGLFGLRNFPDSQWDKFYDASEELLNKVSADLLTTDQLAKRESGTLQWKDLNKWQKDTFLAQNPELKEAYDNAVANENKRRDAQEVQWAADRDQYIADRETADNADFAILRAGGNEEILSTRDLRTHISDNSANYNTLMADLRRRYADLYALFENESGTATQFDIFYNEYYDIIFSEAYTLPGGTPDYEAIDSAIEALRGKYPAEFWPMLDDIKRYGFAGQDPLKLKLWEDKQVFASYFDLPEGQQRLDFRRNPANTEIEAALVFWGYLTTIENEGTEAIVKQWCEDYSVPEKMIPALAALSIPEDMMQKYHITDPTLQRQFSELPEEGWTRDRFLVEHPEFMRYYIDELGHKEFNDKGEPIYDPAKIPSVSEEAYIVSYQGTDSTMRKAWRCRNQEGELALIKFGYLSKVIYGTSECELIMQGGGDAVDFFSQQAQ